MASKAAVAFLVVLVASSLLSCVAGVGPRGHSGAHGVSLSARPDRTIAAVPHPSAAPTLQEAGVAPAAVGLSWSATNDLFFSSYTVEYSVNGSGGPWQAAGVLTRQASTTYAVAGLTPGAAYWWQVVETGGFGGTQASNVLSEVQPPLAVLNVTPLSASSVRFNWTDNATYGSQVTFGSFSLYESVGGAAPALIANLTQATDHSTVVSGLSSGSSYSFYLNTTDCLPGCGGTSISTTQSNTVTYGTPLPLVASISAERTVLDTGQAEYLTCIPSGGQSPFHVAWDFGNGSFVPGPSSVGHVFAAPSVPVVRCEVTDAVGSRSTAATSLTVDPAPTVGVSANRTAADVGQPIALTCSAGAGTPPYTVAITFGDGAGTTVLPGSPVTHTYTSPGSVPATCLLTDAVGAQVTATVGIVVSSDPSARASASAEQAAPGTLLSFTGLGLNGTGNFTAYAWSFGDGTTGTGPAVAHSFSSPGAYSVTLRAIDSNGGTASENLTVKVLDLTVALSGVPSTVPLGGSVLLTALAAGGAGAPYNFTWRFGDGSVAHGAQVRHTFGTVGPTSLSLEVTDRLGAVVNAPTTTVQVLPPPAPSPPLSGSAVLAIAALLGAAVALIGYMVLRRRFEAEHASMKGYVPPVDPRRAVHGVKVCRTCGAPNVPLRSTCQHCGAGLPRASWGKTA